MSSERVGAIAGKMQSLSSLPHGTAKEWPLPRISRSLVLLRYNAIAIKCLQVGTNLLLMKEKWYEAANTKEETKEFVVISSGVKSYTIFSKISLKS